MHNIQVVLRHSSAAALFSLCAQAAWCHTGIDADDQKRIDAASCEEIVKQHGIHVAEERALVAEMQRTTNGTVATNVVGAATLAVFGLGFFTWDNNADAEENLAELRLYRDAIAAAGRKKGCALPQ